VEKMWMLGWINDWFVYCLLVEVGYSEFDVLS